MRVLACLLLVAISSPAFAGPPGPVCRNADVLEEMRHELRDRFYYAHVQPALVVEQPTAHPDVVRCEVCVESAPYDMPRFGDRPIRQCLPHGFEVRILRMGFVVRDLG